MTVRHGDKEFNDSPIRPYCMSKRIVRSYYGDECDIAVVSGMPEGIGKSAYVNHVLADVYGYQACRDKELLKVMWLSRQKMVGLPRWDTDWEMVKPFVLYLPENVVKTCKEMLLKGVRRPAFHWDDAGTWLNAMEYHDPFVIAFMEYLSLARSNWAMIVLSTPVEEWILKKLRTAEGLLRVKIAKPKNEHTHRYIWKPRIATCYKMTRYIGTARRYYPRQWIDHFVAIMPDEFYEWYKPRRDKYAILSTYKMEKALKRRKAKGWGVSDEEAVLAEIRRHIDTSHDEVKDFREVLELAQKKELD